MDALRLFDQPAEDVVRTATFSTCGRWRYRLGRKWEDGPTVLFAMLNPSTADAEKDDPTIRRCMRFARDWGYGELLVVNLFALRATDPRQMLEHPYPVGVHNDEEIRRASWAADAVVVAWGAHGAHLDRDLAVLRLLGRRVDCLGVTAQGMPTHPLYLPSAAKRIPYEGREGQ